MDRVVAVVLLVALVAVAGCSAMPGAGTGDDGLTTERPSGDDATSDQATNDTATEEQSEIDGPVADESSVPDTSLDESALPPGVTANDVDLETLASAHRRNVTGEAYRAERTTWSNDSVGTRETTIVERLDPQAERRSVVDVFTSTYHERSGNEHIEETCPECVMADTHREASERYETATARYVRRGPVDGSPQYETRSVESFEPAQSDVVNLTDLLVDAMVGEYAADGSTTVDGRPATVLRATDVLPNPDYEPALGGSPPTVAELRSSIDGFEATMVVDEDGVVRSFEREYTVVGDDGRRLTERRLTLELNDVGTATVDEPAWIDEAPAPHSDDEPTVSKTYDSADAGATLELVGHPDAHVHAGLSRIQTGHYDPDAPFERGRVSAYVSVDINEGARVDRASITLTYDGASVPDGDEGNVELFWDDRRDPDEDDLTIFWGHMRTEPNATVDAQNETIHVTIESPPPGDSMVAIYVPEYVDTWEEMLTSGDGSPNHPDDIQQGVLISEPSLDSSAFLHAREIPSGAGIGDGRDRLPDDVADDPAVVSGAVHLSAMDGVRDLEELQVMIRYDGAVPDDVALSMYVYDGTEFHAVDETTVDRPNRAVHANVGVHHTDPTFIVVLDDEWDPPDR